MIPAQSPIAPNTGHRPPDHRHIEQRPRRHRQAEQRPQPHPQPEQQLCRLIATLVATAFGVSVRDLQATRRGPAPVAFARQAAMYLGHVVFGLNLTRVGYAFGRDRTTARHACRLIEDCRDDPAVDRFIGLLECCCTGAGIESYDDHAVRS